MACENGGDFADIPALGAVRSVTQKYFDILSLPIDDIGARWTSAYPDVISGKSVISAMMPAFRTDPETTKKQFQGTTSASAIVDVLSGVKWVGTRLEILPRYKR